MIRLCLLAGLVLAASLTFPIASHQAQANTLIAQDDNGNAQATPDPGAASDTGKDDNSNSSGEDRD